MQKFIYKRKSNAVPIDFIDSLNTELSVFYVNSMCDETKKENSNRDNLYHLLFSPYPFVTN